MDMTTEKQLQKYVTAGEQTLARTADASITHNNHIELLYDSTDNFPAWEAALHNAEESIFIEMYIFNNDQFGRKIRNILIQQLQKGVDVVLIYDWFGSINSHYTGFFKPLIHAGAQIHPYNKLSFFTGIDVLSRNHRKLLIIDKKIAFISGLCISSQWEGNIEKNELPWRDAGVRLTGAIVQETVTAFYETLSSENIQLANNITNKDPSPSLAETEIGDVSARLIAGTPGSANMMRLDMFIISMAQESLWITDAYFIGSSSYLSLLKNAAEDGVDVRLLVPKTSDIAWIGAASRTQYRTLLKAGVRIFEWNGSMIHAKTCVADGYWARIGSSNINMSSWLANRELDVAIQDGNLAKALQEKFLSDIENSTEVILNENDIEQLKELRPKRHSSVRAKAFAAARQASRISHYLRGDTRIIGEPESNALLSFAGFALILALLFFVFPNLIAIPLALILLISGTVSATNALNQLKQDKKNRRIED